MSNETEEATQAAKKAEEEKTLNQEEPTLEDEKADDKQEVDNKTLLAQKIRYREKLEKSEVENKELRAELASSQKVEDKEKPSMSEADWKEKVDFILANPKLSTEAVNHISIVAKGSGRSLSDAAEDKDVVKYLEYRSQQVEADKDPLDSTSRVSVSEKHDLKKLSTDEIKKIYPELVKEILSKKSNQA